MASARTLLARLASASRRPRSSAIAGGSPFPIGLPGIGRGGALPIGSSGAVGGLGQVRHYIDRAILLGDVSDDHSFLSNYVWMGLLAVGNLWMKLEWDREKPKVEEEIAHYEQRRDAAKARLDELDEYFFGGKR